MKGMFTCIVRKLKNGIVIRTDVSITGDGSFWQKLERRLCVVVLATVPATIHLQDVNLPL
ncbi:hypothetical protein [Marinobacter adhaerens]|uniref:hypothetical protein n=1 Tax=Marinobacter adhaerens TaxID=1033846 RepID=UPI003BACF912